MVIVSPSRSAPASPNHAPMCCGWVTMSHTRSGGAAMTISRSMVSIAGPPVFAVRNPDVTRNSSVTQERDVQDFRGSQEAERQAARADPARDQEVPPVLDDVPADVALAVVRGDQRAPQEGDRHLPAVQVAGQRERD